MASHTFNSACFGATTSKTSVPGGATLAVTPVLAAPPPSPPPPEPPPSFFPPFFLFLPLAFFAASTWLAKPARASVLPRLSLGPLAGLGSMDVTFPLYGTPLFQALVAFFASSSVGKATTFIYLFMVRGEKDTRDRETFVCFGPEKQNK